MQAVLLTLYVLVWPVTVGGVLFVICRAFLRELREAKSQGRTII